MTGTPGKATPTKSSLNKELPSVGPDDIFSPAKPTPGGSSVKKEAAPSPQLRPTSRLSVPQNEPFLFGSPLPRHSMTNTQFDNAAADVLAEMNRRLAAAGVPKVEKTVLETAGKSSAPSALPAKAAPSATAERFNKAHDQAFNKMDSIANHYAARRPAPGAASSAVGAAAGPASKKRKSDALGPGAGPAAKRKSNVAQARVFSNGNRKKMGIPGGFGMDDDDDDENENDAPEEDADAADRRASKRIRVAEGEDVHKGRRVSLLPQDGKTDAERAAEERRREKEREVLKRKIDARRRSSRGRPSVGGRAAPAAASECSRCCLHDNCMTDCGRPQPRPNLRALASSALQRPWFVAYGIWVLEGTVPRNLQARLRKPLCRHRRANLPQLRRLLCHASRRGAGSRSHRLPVLRS